MSEYLGLGRDVFWGVKDNIEYDASAWRKYITATAGCMAIADEDAFAQCYVNAGGPSVPVGPPDTHAFDRREAATVQARYAPPLVTPPPPLVPPKSTSPKRASSWPLRIGVIAGLGVVGYLLWRKR